MRLEELTSLLIKFRYHQIILSTDVEKAILQIALHRKDYDVTRFQWIKDLSKPLMEDNSLHMRFCRVTFGIINSQLILNATIKKYRILKEIENTNKQNGFSILFILQRTTLQ